MKNGTIFLHVLCNMFVQLQNYQNYKSCAFVLYLALCKKTKQNKTFFYLKGLLPMNCR